MLEDLLKQTRETTTLDFKREIRLSSENEKKEFAKDVSALANTKGGHIVFGKEDPKEGGRIVGIKRETFDPEQMQQIVAKRCYPPARFDAELILFESKWFVLVTIHESSLKPHEIVEIGLVYVRRGSTTGRATSREIMQMYEESKKKVELKETQPSEETSLAAFEGRAVTATVVSLFILLYVPIRLVTFWALGKGLDLINWLSFEAIAPPIVLVIIISVLKSLFGDNFMKRMMRLPRKISVPYLASLIVFVLAILILNITISLYPDSTRVFFYNSWIDFLVICTWSLIIALMATVLSYFPIAQYFAKLEDLEYMPNPAKEMKQLIHEWKQKMKLLRNKFSASIMLGLLLVTVAIIPIDIATGLFIPSYHEEGESFCHSYNVSDKIYLFIYSDRISPSTIRSECKFYRLVSKSYTIYPAKLPLLSTIRIPNPTNITTGSTKDPAIDATSSDISKKSLGYVSINTTRNVQHEFIPVTHNFTHVEFEFSKVSEPFVANMSYWKSLENVNISVNTTEPQYVNLGNGTWLETYTFIVVNNEEIPLTTMALEFYRFIYSVVNRTTTKVYSQGQELEFAYFVYLDRLAIWLTIGPGKTLNLTVTFQSSDIT